MMPAIEIKHISERLESALEKFFRTIRRAGDENYFHPHPFDKITARAIAHHSGKDLYYAVVSGTNILGYGMLRGWDEGYEVPSLGIIIHPEMRKMKLGEMLMYFLHSAARFRGARKIRLKVHPDNLAAFKMYQNLGYIFQEKELGQWIGILDL